MKKGQQPLGSEYALIQTHPGPRQQQQQHRPNGQRNALYGMPAPNLRQANPRMSEAATSTSAITFHKAIVAG